MEAGDFLTSPGSGFSARDAHKRINFINYALIAIVGALLIGFITLLVTVSGLTIDAWRFNSTACTEYSEKINSLQELKQQNLQLNQKIIEQQQSIKDQQAIIIKLLGASK